MKQKYLFLFITATPLNSIQGSGTFVSIATLKRALETLGHSVEILAPDFWCPSYVLRRYLFNCFLPKKVQALLKEGRMDVAVGFDCDGYRLKTSVPYIVSIKGVLADEANQEKGIIRWLLRLQAWWELRNTQKARMVMVTSQYCKKMVQRSYRVDSNKIKIVPELIDRQGWEDWLAGVPLRTDSKGTTVLTVCRMYPRKNLGLLLRAWTRVNRKEPTARLRIVGSGQEYKRWLNLAKDLNLQSSVTFLGDRTREELAKEYKNCDIFCLPSRQEGFGIVFLEAMVAGKPVVATRAGAIPEVVRQGQEGFLVSPDDPIALANALLRLSQSPDLRKQMGRSAQAYVKQYDAPNVAEQFISQSKTSLFTPTDCRIAMEPKNL